MQISLVYDTTLLSRSALYRIDGYFYRFLGEDPYASIRAPRYRFRPIPKQRRRADLTLGHRRLTASVYQVEGVRIGRHAAASGRHVQLSLF